MFRTKLYEDRSALQISENKLVKTLSTSDQDIFIRSYFKEISIILTAIIDKGYLKFEGNEKAQSFFTTLYKIRESADSKDIFASFRVFEENMPYVYESIYDPVIKGQNIFGLLNIENFCFNLGLIIQNFYSDQPIQNLDKIIFNKSTKEYSKGQFKKIQDMVADPLNHILKLETLKFKEQMILFLINNRSTPRDEIDENIKLVLSQGLVNYPRIDHVETIDAAIVNCKEKRQLETIIPLTEINTKLLATLDELKNLNSKKNIM